MPILVDGDNLLGTWPGRSRSDAEKRALALELSRFARRKGQRVVVVFDGEPPPGLHFGADVLFSGRGRKADDAILARLRGESDRRGWLVVTTDRPLGDQCRHLGARIERSDRFRGRLRSTGEAEKPEREQDVEYWLERFAPEETEREDGAT